MNTFLRLMDKTLQKASSKRMTWVLFASVQETTCCPGKIHTVLPRMKLPGTCCTEARPPLIFAAEIAWDFTPVRIGHFMSRHVQTPKNRTLNVWRCPKLMHLQNPLEPGSGLDSRASNYETHALICPSCTHSKPPALNRKSKDKFV